MATSCNIRVMCRFRPLNEREKALKENQTCVTFPDETQVIVSGQPFTFDRVFTPESTQKEVFESVKDTIHDVLLGYNGTLLAYGQTGSGKTFTMGSAAAESDFENVEQLGIIPRGNHLIFNTIAEESDGNAEFTIKCSYLEIYMENIQDLLNPKNNKQLKIRESKSQGIYVEGLTEEYVASEEDIMELIQVGESSRSVAKTNMNQRSSRSHSILIIAIEQKSSDGSKKRGKLNLVDLAGSEKVSKTGAEGIVLEQAKKINQSLSLLGNCIHALTDSKREHIPFRDSKLTRLLQDSLGGNTKTTLLVTASPHFNNVDETISTLKFGARAKSIKNNVKVNQEKSAAELQIIVNALTKELSILKVYSISLENLVNYFKSSSYQPGNPIPKELEPNKQNLLLLQQQSNSSSGGGGSGSSGGSSNGSLMMKPRSTTPTPPSINRPHSSASTHRHSIAITGTHSKEGSGGGLTSSISSSSISSMSSLSSSIDNDYNGSSLDDSNGSNGLFNPLAIVEMSIEMEKMKEDTQLLIEKFKDEISEITIQYQSTQEELNQCRQQLDQIKEQLEQQRSQFIKEQSLLKESERNATLDSTSKDLKIQSLISKIEDLRLLASQVIQYLERKRLSDDFDIGIFMGSQDGANGDSANMFSLISNSIDQGTYEDDVNIEDIIRYLSEEEVLTMQVKLQLQNKVHQLEQKIQQLVSDLNTTEINYNQSILQCQKFESENSLIKRKFKSMFSSSNNNNNNNNSPPSSPSSKLLIQSSNNNNNFDSNLNSSSLSSSLPSSNGIEQDQQVDHQVDHQVENDHLVNDEDNKLLDENSKLKENELKLLLEIKNLKLQSEKSNDETLKWKDELSIKSALYQNQILNLQNENQSLSNKLNVEKQQKQSSQSQQIEFATKLNDLIKSSEDDKELYRNEKNQMELEIASLKASLDEMDLKNKELQDQLISTQRLIGARRVVKIVRGGADSMKTALATKEVFGQFTLRKTENSKTLFQ
ncbi:hypothetical protein DDB_G0276369 [Dictyostelium discoideum AX4]|uniref:Kinesin-related protein 5 n=1 Tax=Dictyostelium discoideum TaxID=44689 RepID=KIF5_DICDI|nr:hypothetical protein DDB_G0276369 [Dictyostelium discoideum AX4]Q8T135.1 RecName: Full=Kinesin-related protein 5; AltName: Full=Kinesin family member 5; AltName: Full=Kinesin-1 [Dictyostelium discoideum]EAL69265.1 hypothetical protein DDB_G0276369 [Dictyostelium discoideum AX4]BAC56910.1 kinesin-related protein DdKin5 [Dictyostelium discoideum]|eukprot:XP_643173.1 hypothetical protein DDB_G0276369 [Dictyostelium discoideum AX4]